MKKLAVYTMAALMLFAFTPMQANSTPTSAVATPINVKTAETEEILLRLDEINEIDKSTLKFSEKKELRKEVRSINKELKERQSGIYLSVGAVILILILLIILL
jgi:hypothetical protein